MAVGAHTRPTLKENDAIGLAENIFGFAVAEIRSLPSERDQNFYIKDNSGKEFVLKIAGSADGHDVLDMQNRAMIHLAECVGNNYFPRVCATKSGEQIATITAANGHQFHVRLLTYLPGQLFAKTRRHSPELLKSLGNLLGRIDAALQTFSHTSVHRELKWDLKIAGWISDYTSQINTPERRAIVEHFLKQFGDIVVPAFSTIRSSVIHNDANDYNVLVQMDEAGNQCVAGLIDFGDMVHSYTICELAVALAYAMLNKPDPLAAGAQIIAGYHKAFPLTEEEVAVLFHLVCMRLCVSVTNSAIEQKREPDNPYMIISEQPAWELLERLYSIDPAFAHYTFRAACGFDPCPKTAAVVSWLRKNQDQIGPVIEHDLAGPDALVFDLSAASQDIDNLSEIPDTPLFSRKLFKWISDANASVGIGKYDEARLLYISDLFKSEGNDGPHWRTVHLGIDLFLPEGSPVLSALDGKIHSYRNNVGLLDYGPAIVVEHEFNSGRIKFYTIYGHLSEDSLQGLYPGKPVKRGDVIARIGNYPINGNWPPHVHFQIITDLLGRSGEFPGVALPSERDVWLSISPDPNLILKIPAELLADRTLDERAIRLSRQQHIGPSFSISYKQPLTIVRGSMQYLYDDTGRAYLDAVNNVPHVGHCHPKVVRAGQRQMAVLNTNTRYLHENLVRYAERLCATLPDPLKICYFVCSGSEANELALRLAKAHTKRKDIIVVDGGYHGNTNALVEISPYKFDGPGGSGAPDYVHKVPMPDVYRGPHKSTDAGSLYAQSIAEAIREAEISGRQIGAFICESILSCGGQIVLPENYLCAAYQHVRNAGGVCIADEVQVGFGRAGTHFWAFETQEVVPDIVTMGKPIGNGHPLAAVVTTPEIAASFNNRMEYFNTFGGNPVSCAIGMVVLDVIEGEHLQENALAVGNHLKDGLTNLMSRHSLIGDVRGLGLFVGIEFVLDRHTLTPAARQASYIVERMKDRGILLSTDGPLHNVIKIKPPLVFSKSDSDYLIRCLDEILMEDFLHPQIE